MPSSLPTNVHQRFCQRAVSSQLTQFAFSAIHALSRDTREYDGKTNLGNGLLYARPFDLAAKIWWVLAAKLECGKER